MIHSLMEAGTFNEEFYAQDGGSDITTDGSTWHPVTIPSGKKYTKLVIQCQKETPVFDTDLDLTAFRFSASAAGPGIEFSPEGACWPLAFGAHENDKVVGYVQAAAGYKILVGLIG